ncbi:MAG: phosphoribosylamine--glycine ligase [Acidobacteria bacterium]|nr:phosphoribosylamine--glycine ligase [Acidobacteriota bacterium]
MKALVIGGGGREHAIAWKLSQSSAVSQVLASPGNPGIASLATCFAQIPPADLVVVGPEAPLVSGVVDDCRAQGIPVVGPTREQARLEGSKIHAKEFMNQLGIPTARYQIAETIEEAHRALARFDMPVVLKADGLAAGKGVIIARTREEAREACTNLLSGLFVGSAGARIVIEDCLPGEEVSFIALSDGKTILPLEPTQDHKAIFDGDQGPNTGGMGAYCDSRILTASQRQFVLDRVIQPVVESTGFTGFLYAGLMMTSDGPKVLEFNVRLGDPETQALMYRIDSDFGALMHAAALGELHRASLEWKRDPSVCIVLAAHNYPGDPRKGDPITGIEAATQAGAMVFHAGTALRDGVLQTAGGRVLGVTASGPTLAEAIATAYAATSNIHFPGMQYRRDIGAKGLARWQ